MTYADTKPFALGLAQLLERRRPELVVSDMRKTLRTGKILVDWSQNDEAQDHGLPSTRCVPASGRPSPPRCAGGELEGVLASGDPEDLAFTAEETLARVAEHGDLFAPVLELAQPLPTGL